MDALVLAARECVKEAVDRSRITPIQGRVAHRSQRHVKVKSRAKCPNTPAGQRRQPILRKSLGSDNEINEGYRHSEAYDVHEHEETSLILKRRGVTGYLRKHCEQPRQRADHREIP